MSQFTHPITLIGPSGRSETLDAIVDTGTAFTTVPESVLERLGVSSHRTARLQMAKGQLVGRRLGRVTAQIGGMEELILCMFGPEDAPPTIGRHTLEVFLLTVEPSGERLVPRDGYLLVAQTPVR